MKELRSSEAIVHAQRLVSDRTSTTILLFSPSGVQTPFHFDWTEATNLALEVEVRTEHSKLPAVPHQHFPFFRFLFHIDLMPHPSLFPQGVTDPGRAVAAWYFVSPVRLEPFLSFFKGIKFVYEKVPKGYKLDHDVFSEEHCFNFMSTQAAWSALSNV
eukprot:452105-Pelagomonas_calceolata.AAC.2